MNVKGQELVDLLMAHARTHNLKERAAQGIVKWLESPDTVDMAEGIARESIVGRFSSHGLCFEQQHVAAPFVDTRFDLCSGEKVVGYYRLITRLDGESEDDYFVIDGWR